MCRRHILDAPGVADVHDLHAWSITSGVNVVSAHVVLDPGAEPAGVLDFLCECLVGDFDIEHSTFQLESSDRRRPRGRDRTGERGRRNRPRPVGRHGGDDDPPGACPVSGTL
jgi:hypothetical protein